MPSLNCCPDVPVSFTRSLPARTPALSMIPKLLCMRSSLPARLAYFKPQEPHCQDSGGRRGMRGCGGPGQARARGGRACQVHQVQLGAQEAVAAGRRRCGRLAPLLSCSVQIACLQLTLTRGHPATIAAEVLYKYSTSLCWRNARGHTNAMRCLPEPGFGPNPRILPCYPGTCRAGQAPWPAGALQAHERELCSLRLCAATARCTLPASSRRAMSASPRTSTSLPPATRRLGYDSACATLQSAAVTGTRRASRWGEQ